MVFDLNDQCDHLSTNNERKVKILVASISLQFDGFSLAIFSEFLKSQNLVNKMCDFQTSQDEHYGWDVSGSSLSTHLICQRRAALEHEYWCWCSFSRLHKSRYLSQNDFMISNDDAQIPLDNSTVNFWPYIVEGTTPQASLGNSQNWRRNNK